MRKVWKPIIESFVMLGEFHFSIMLFKVLERFCYCSVPHKEEVSKIFCPFISFFPSRKEHLVTPYEATI